MSSLAFSVNLSLAYLLSIPSPRRSLSHSQPLLNPSPISSLRPSIPSSTIPPPLFPRPLSPSPTSSVPHLPITLPHLRITVRTVLYNPLFLTLSPIPNPPPFLFRSPALASWFRCLQLDLDKSPAIRGTEFRTPRIRNHIRFCS